VVAAAKARPMTKEQLRQLRYLKSEIKLLKGQIADVEFAVVTDSVKGSDPRHPYNERTFTITGVDYESYRSKTKRLRRKLQRRVDELIDLVMEINEYIESIDDSLLRQIISLRHINGLTWGQVAASIGGGNTAESVRKIHDRYLQNI
jgi:hypothetical protein